MRRGYLHSAHLPRCLMCTCSSTAMFPQCDISMIRSREMAPMNGPLFSKCNTILAWLKAGRSEYGPYVISFSFVLTGETREKDSMFVLGRVTAVLWVLTG